MTDIKQYTPLRTIVSYTLDELDKSIADADKCWVLGLRALTDMNFEVAGQTKTVRIAVQPNKTFILPNDCLSWIKVGNLNENGEVVTLRVNEALTTFRDNNPNRTSSLTADINNGVGSAAILPFYSNYYYGGNCFQLFGLGGGIITYGDCKIDEKNRVGVLGLDFRYDSVMFEYLSSPERDEDYQVLTCLQEAIIMFIKWKLKLARDVDYYAEVTKARRRLPKKRAELQTINQVIRESEGMKLRS